MILVSVDHHACAGRCVCTVHIILRCAYIFTALTMETKFNIIMIVITRFISFNSSRRASKRASAHAHVDHALVDCCALVICVYVCVFILSISSREMTQHRWSDSPRRQTPNKHNEDNEISHISRAIRPISAFGCPKSNTISPLICSTSSHSKTFNGPECGVHKTIVQVIFNAAIHPV